MRARAMLVAGLLIAATECSSAADTFTTSVTQDCSTDFVPKFAPGDTTIAVGQSFTEALTLTTCSGTRTVVDSYTWSSSDPTKVTIDAQTAVVKGIAPGSARLTAIGAFYGSFLGGFVTVK